MSDLQILTGISILVSAFAQLRCGLSAYHWQIMCSLAWFSSLTHLSCLTILRNNLYNHPGERLWRLFGMAIVVGLLIVALVPTANYDWTPYNLKQSMPALSDYAICYLNWQPNDNSITLVSTIVSISILAVGFLTRLVRVIKTLSIDVLQHARGQVSNRLQKWLMAVYNKLQLDEPSMTLSFQRTLIYWPLLAMFLAVRVAVDTWLSMAAEVSASLQVYD